MQIYFICLSNFKLTQDLRPQHNQGFSQNNYLKTGAYCNTTFFFAIKQNKVFLTNCGMNILQIYYRKVNLFPYIILVFLAIYLARIFFMMKKKRKRKTLFFSLLGVNKKKAINKNCPQVKRHANQ